MRDWNLRPGDPLSLTLAADARLCVPDYSDDQIWELSLGAGDLGAMVLQTTYGLRARNMRLFPRFIEGDEAVSDPAAFETTAAVRRFYPNYLKLTCSPFPGLDVTAEYWVPESRVVAGRLRLHNSGVTPRAFGLEWAALLNPAGGGKPMAIQKMELATVLAGQTDGLAPLVFLTGGPGGSNSPYPALSHNIELLPGASRQLTWVHAALATAEDSFALARSVAARNWEAELARIEMTNASQVEITTGDPDWDAAFALGQKVAFSLIHGPTEHLSHPSFVFARQPDQGHSPRGDGSEYNYLWNGQTALEALYLADLVLPGAPQIAKGLLLNFLSVQGEGGRVDWKPGLAGQRSGLLATPVLASLAWKVYQASEDRAFLEQVFSPLQDFLQAWFAPGQDRDGDGVPEWDHPMQTGFDDHPAFARWHPWAQGADITLTEDPALCAYLCREAHSLTRIAEALGRSEPLGALQALAENLRSAVEAAWDEGAATYRYWDRDTHRSQPGELLGERRGSGEIFLDMVFDLPVRLLLRIETGGDTTLQAHAFVHGALPGGQHRVERIGRDRIQWFMGLGTATGEHLYADLERLQVEGLGPNDRASFHVVDHHLQDHSLLLPLWAGIPGAARAETLIERTVLAPERYGRRYGLPACPDPPRHEGAAVCECAWLPWNAMVGEGLLAYGRREQAAELLSRLMAGIVQNLKREGAFRKHYHADTGRGQGDRNALAGLPPLGLFLATLGVRLLSPWRVALEGFNPYPWPIKIKYRGLTVECFAEKTVVTFPNGEARTVHDPAPCLLDGAAGRGWRP